MYSKLTARLIFGYLLIFGAHKSAQAAPVHFQFEPLGELPPNANGYFAFDHSSFGINGCSIAGTILPEGIFAPAAWRDDVGFVPVEAPPQTYPNSTKTILSTVISNAGILAGRHVWRFDEPNQIFRFVQVLPSIFTNEQTLVSVAAMATDGSVFGGWSRNDETSITGDYRATVWRPLDPNDPESPYVAEPLHPFVGDTESAVQDVSSDGSVMVGYSINKSVANIHRVAVRWTPDISPEAHLLPTPETPHNGIMSALVSPNGKEIVISRCNFFFGDTASTCSVNLSSSDAATIALDIGKPYAVSDNRVVVAQIGGAPTPVVWADYLRDPREVAHILEHAGLSYEDATAWLSQSSFDISADGRTLLGPGIDPDTDAQGLIKITLPLPGDADDNEKVNLTDFAALKSALGQNGTALPTDFDFDTDVDSSDFSILQSHFGERGLPPTLGTCFSG